MDRCVELARTASRAGNYALGSLVLADGAILAETGSSLVGADNDPSAHPEMTAIRRAACARRSRYLTGAYLVTTLEPCPMCTSVAIWAKMAGIVFGATQQDAKNWSTEHPDELFTWRQIEIRARDVVAAGTPALEVHEGIRRDECRALFALNKSPAV
ncbi:nucleoside deaminase [Actinokineospora inagensis]|uniref:nucleoside deaminase n=1 Tax=Actinokineospora inagensis TaxID=103730 RepID=UPI00146F98EB|nr:nucleoside deaminase [Actinokineospora inagensis]